MEMCLVLGLNCMSVVAKMMHELLSSKTLEGGRDGVWTLSDGVEEEKEMKLCN
jgi:hypothetical protein